MNPEYEHTVFILTEFPSIWPDEFAIITAYNPMDKKLSDGENRKRNQELTNWAKEKAFIDLIGSSPDRTHQEQSIGVTFTLKEAIEVGLRFNQRAIFYVKNGNLELVECNSGKSKCLGKLIGRILPVSTS